MVGPWPPPAWQDVEGGYDEERYASSPARPTVQLALRVGLWAAVGLGCVGGALGLIRPSGAAPAPTAEMPSSALGVPAAVAGTAELAVAEWLAADSDDQARLANLFVEMPSLETVSNERLTVDFTNAVAGQVLGDGYWSVTVAAGVTEAPPPSDEEVGHSTDLASEEAPYVLTWYVELGIVGDPATGLAALATPAILPAPVARPAGWSVAGATMNPPDEDDPVTSMVDGFLSAALTGASDPDPYLAPGADLPTSATPPFEEITVLATGVTPLDDGSLHVRVEVQATTPGESRHNVSYEIVAAQRAGRWEVVSLSGLPVAQRAAAEDPRGG